MIKLTYTIKGRQHNFCRFRNTLIFLKYLEAIKARGAYNIKIEVC